MSLPKCPYLFVVVALCLAFGATSALAAEAKMAYEEYEAQWGLYRERVASLEKELADLQQSIDATEKETADVETQIAAVWREIYALIGSDEAGVKAFMDALDEIEAEIRNLRMLSPDDLWKRRKEINALEQRIMEQTASKIAALPSAADKITRLARMIGELRAMFPKVPPADQYTVVRGDCLWSISKKEDIYNDAYMWPRIFRANRDQIKDPDVIYPKQIFLIPRGVPLGYHLVVRGEWLAKIAGYPEVFGDVTKWTKIYQANKDQIRDPNLIYPAQELLIPEE